jgi:hypothetical protein
VAVKHDFPPLLPPGYHTLTLDKIKRLCVDPFPTVQQRRYLFLHLEQLVQDLLLLAIVCDVWTDGSFVTEHPSPDDLDVIIKLDYDVANSLTTHQREFIDDLNERRCNDRVDSWVFTCFPRHHDLFFEQEADRSTWAKLYSVERSGMWLKGVAVIKVGETDVGLRICS